MAPHIPKFLFRSRQLLFLGEIDKWIAVSGQRFLDVSVTDVNAYVRVTGAPRENVLLHYTLDATYVTVNCLLSEGGAATLDVILHRCR